MFKLCACVEYAEVGAAGSGIEAGSNKQIEPTVLIEHVGAHEEGNGCFFGDLKAKTCLLPLKEILGGADAYTAHAVYGIVKNVGVVSAVVEKDLGICTVEYGIGEGRSVIGVNVIAYLNVDGISCTNNEIGGYVYLAESVKQRDYAERKDVLNGVSVAVNTIAESFVQDTIIYLAVCFQNRRMSVMSVSGEENAKRIEPTTSPSKQMLWQGEDIPIPEAKYKPVVKSLKDSMNWFHR